MTNVTPAVAVTSDVNPSIWGQGVTFTATVTPLSATGTVTFKDSLTTLAVVAVSGGTAQLVKSNLHTGNLTQITASYSGDGCFKTATSPPYSQLVYRAASTTGLTSDINPSTFGQTVKLTASVTPIGATGRVTFYDAGNPIGTGAVSGSTGLATLTTNNLVPGTHALTASYPGDSHYGSSASSTYNQVVNPIPSSTVLSVPSAFGTPCMSLLFHFCSNSESMPLPWYFVNEA